MQRLRQVLPPARGLIPLALLLVAWQLLLGPSPDFPPPSSWWTAVSNLATRHSLWPAVWATLYTFTAGLAISSLLGFILGILIGTNVAIRQWSGMLLEYFRALPPPVIIPIAVLIAGYSPSMKIAVIAITASWPILLNTISGVARIHNLQFDVARSLRMSKFEMLWKIAIPATIPDFLLGVRVALSLAIITTLLVEMFTGLPGVGFLIMLGQRSYDSREVFGLLAIIGIMAFLLTLIFAIAEGLVLRRWPPRHDAGL